MLTVSPGDFEVLWVTLYSSTERVAGDYVGGVHFLRSGIEVLFFPVSLRVWDFDLSEEPSLESLYGSAPWFIDRYHHAETAEQRTAIRTAYLKSYHEHRLSPFLYPLSQLPYQFLPGGDVSWQFVKRDGSGDFNGVDIDFGNAAALFSTLFGEPYHFRSFNFAPYVFDKETSELYLVDSSSNRITRQPPGLTDDNFDQLIVEYFSSWGAFLSQEGLLDRAVYYLADEPSVDSLPYLKLAASLIREADPRIRIAMTYDIEGLTDEDGNSLVDIFIPRISKYNPARAQAYRNAGAGYWVYDVSDLALIDNSSAENRMLPWLAWERNAGGILYYLTNYYNTNNPGHPWQQTNWRQSGGTYTNWYGDGVFFYPPEVSYTSDGAFTDRIVPSVRWEVLRDGAEDFEYLISLNAMLPTLSGAARDAGNSLRALSMNVSRFAEISELVDDGNVILGAHWSVWHSPTDADVAIICGPSGQADGETTLRLPTTLEGPVRTAFYVNAGFTVPDGKLWSQLVINGQTVTLEAVDRYRWVHLPLDVTASAGEVVLRVEKADPESALYLWRLRLDQADSLSHLRDSVGELISATR